MTYSTRFQRTIDSFIELHGDRTEGIGDEIRAGFAWIGDTKFVLIAGNEGGVQKPSSWRRLSRLLSLAKQFRRPVLLWDVSAQVASTDFNPTLLNRSTSQNSQLQWLQLPLPIISVWDRLVTGSLESTFAGVDAAVLLKNEGIVDGQHLPISSMGNKLSVQVRVIGNSSDIKSDILELLDQISTTPLETLVQHRINRVRSIVNRGV
jgi:hypothetical protein